MISPEEKMSLMTQAAQSDYKGSFEELFASGGQESPMQEAVTPQQQEQGLRGAPSGSSMSFPNSSGDFNTVGMENSLDIQKFDDNGDLVRSYESVPPGVQNLPMGDDVGTVIETPAEYQTGGIKKDKPFDVSSGYEVPAAKTPEPYTFDPFEDLAAQSDNTSFDFPNTNADIPYTRVKQIQAELAENSSNSNIRSQISQDKINKASGSFFATQVNGGVGRTAEMLTTASKEGRLDESLNNLASYSSANDMSKAASFLPIVSGGASLPGLGAWGKIPSLFKKRSILSSIAAASNYVVKPFSQGAVQGAKTALGTVASTAHLPFIAGMPGLVDFKDSYIGKGYDAVKKGNLSKLSLNMSDVFSPKSKIKTAFDVSKTLIDAEKSDWVSTALRTAAIASGVKGSGEYKSVAEIINKGTTAVRKSLKVEKKLND